MPDGTSKLAADPLLGRSVRQFRIEAKLGEGGMGAVYRAEHVHMRKAVALKVLHAEVSATPEAVARFEREAIAAGNITHPNVAAATDFGQLSDGSFFLVLEYVDGKSLRALLNEERLAPARALHIVFGIASALSAAHALGIVHRDLKPENVMLVPRPSPLPGGGESLETVKVLDFGIAKVDVDGVGVTPARATDASQRAQPLTRIGAVFGTPDYMSPEQGLGQPVDARSDLYTIGVILYELLTGQRPFQGGSVTIIRQHVLDEVPPLAPELVATLDPRVLPLLDRLLAKSPDQRLASADELCRALESLIASPALAHTTHAPLGDAASAPLGVMATVLAPSDGPAPEAVVSTPPPVASRRRALVATGAAVLLGGAVALGAVAFARRGAAPYAEVPVVTASTAPPPAVEPPPPPEPAPSATSESAPQAETDEASLEPAEAPTKRGASTAGKPAKGAKPPKKRGAAKSAPRKTGPGGIYIPPPKNWFK